MPYSILPVCCSYLDLFSELQDSKEFQQLLVANLPRDGDPNTIRNRLLRLSENCGGKVVKVLPGTAVLRFASMEAASRLPIIEMYKQLCLVL